MFHEVSKMIFGPYGYDGVNWTMSFAERFALVGVLQHRKPVLSLEIGSLEGGSLSIISHFSDRVISIDPNPEVAAKLGPKHSNVTFISKPSQDVLPELIEEMQRSSDPLGFVLVDGDHSQEGVQKDIEDVLHYLPREPLWILMHDSFNPDCRGGIKAVDWDSYPHVHWVDFDFVPGFLNSVPGWEDEMWCGFAVAYLKPEKRDGPVKYDELLGPQFEKVFPLSTHA